MKNSQPLYFQILLTKLSLFCPFGIPVKCTLAITFCFPCLISSCSHMSCHFLVPYSEEFIQIIHPVHCFYSHISNLLVSISVEGFFCLTIYIYVCVCMYMYFFQEVTFYIFLNLNVFTVAIF